MTTTREQLYQQFGPLLIEALARITLDEINILRAQLNLPPRTLQQLMNAMQTQLDQLSPYPWQEEKP